MNSPFMFCNYAYGQSLEDTVLQSIVTWSSLGTKHTALAKEVHSAISNFPIIFGRELVLKFKTYSKVMHKLHMDIYQSVSLEGSIYLISNIKQWSEMTQKNVTW